MAVSTKNLGRTATLAPLKRLLWPIKPLKFVRKVARRSVRHFFYRFVYLRENALCRKIQPLFKRGERQGKEGWNAEYKEGVWKVLYHLREQPHYAVSLSYIINLRPMSSVLDVGCGEGVLYGWLRPYGYARYTGIDFSETAIAKCASYGDEKTNFIVADAEEYVPDRSFDVIVFSESLNCLNEARKAIERYATYLAKDGIFVVSLWRNPRGEAIRRVLKSRFQLIDETLVTNSKGSWWCLALKAAARELTSTGRTRVAL